MRIQFVVFSRNHAFVTFGCLTTESIDEMEQGLKSHFSKEWCLPIEEISVLYAQGSHALRRFQIHRQITVQEVK